MYTLQIPSSFELKSLQPQVSLTVVILIPSLNAFQKLASSFSHGKNATTNVRPSHLAWKLLPLRKLCLVFCSSIHNHQSSRLNTKYNNVLLLACISSAELLFAVCLLVSHLKRRVVRLVHSALPDPPHRELFFPHPLRLLLHVDLATENLPRLLLQAQALQEFQMQITAFLLLPFVLLLCYLILLLLFDRGERDFAIPFSESNQNSST